MLVQTCGGAKTSRSRPSHASLIQSGLIAGPRLQIAAAMDFWLRQRLLGNMQNLRLPEH